jgi:hypothetical protein
VVGVVVISGTIVQQPVEGSRPLVSVYHSVIGVVVGIVWHHAVIPRAHCWGIVGRD